MKKGITLIAVLVAVLAVTSGGFAAANHYLITSSGQIKAGAVSASDLSPAARKALHGKAGAAGAQGLAGAQGPKGDVGDTGATGATGAQGPQGRAGVSGYEVRTWRYSKDDANSDMGPGYQAAAAQSRQSPARPARSRLQAATGSCRTTVGGLQLAAVSDGSGVCRVLPRSHGLEPNTVKPNDNSGCWIVQVNNKVNAADMTLCVVCVNAN